MIVRIEHVESAAAVADQGPGIKELAIASATRPPASKRLAIGRKHLYAMVAIFAHVNRAIAIAVAGLGLGHTVMRAPLYALALRIAGGSGAGLSALRLIERIGAILGLAASALLLGDFGAEISIRVLGIVVLFGIALYAIVDVAGRPGSVR